MPVSSTVPPQRCMVHTDTQHEGYRCCGYPEESKPSWDIFYMCTAASNWGLRPGVERESMAMHLCVSKAYRLCRAPMNVASCTLSWNGSELLPSWAALKHFSLEPFSPDRATEGLVPVESPGGAGRHVTNGNAVFFSQQSLQKYFKCFWRTNWSICIYQ